MKKRARLEDVMKSSSRAHPDPDIKIFLSHSSKDQDLAHLMVDLLTSCIDIGGGEIRCTSLPGYGLKGGVDSVNQLRSEVLSSDILIAILSKLSISSTFVLFELGARWGARKPIIPVLAPGEDHSLLAGPLHDIHALQFDQAVSCSQLVKQVGDQTERALKDFVIVQAKTEQIAKQALNI